MPPTHLLKPRAGTQVYSGPSSVEPTATQIYVSSGEDGSVHRARGPTPWHTLKCWQSGVGRWRQKALRVSVVSQASLMAELQANE